MRIGNLYITEIFLLGLGSAEKDVEGRRRGRALRKWGILRELRFDFVLFYHYFALVRFVILEICFILCNY